jgi:hypothetical protein
MASGDVDIEDSVMVPYTVSASLAALKSSRSPIRATTSAAATVMRLRRMYSDSGIPAS